MVGCVPFILLLCFFKLVVYSFGVIFVGGWRVGFGVLVFFFCSCCVIRIHDPVVICLGLLWGVCCFVLWVVFLCSLLVGFCWLFFGVLVLWWLSVCFFCMLGVLVVWLLLAGCGVVVRFFGWLGL